MGVTTYFAKKILKHVLGIEQIPRSDISVGVGTSSPSSSDEDSWSGELSGNGYERALIRFAEPITSGYRKIKNPKQVRFPEATGNWGSIGYYGLWTAKTGGKLLMYGSFTSSVTVNAGNVLRVKTEGLLVGGNDFTISYAAQDSLLNHVFRKDEAGTEFSLPNVHVALLLSLPAVDDTGSQLDEPSGGNYARKQWTGTNGWNDPTASGSTAESTNKAFIDFNQASADWGTISHAALTDASSGGNWLLAGQLSTSVFIGSGQQPRYGTASSHYLKAQFAAM